VIGVFSRVPKPPNYWSDFRNLEAELLAFIAEHGRAGMMPTASDLREAGCGSLCHVVVQHGGFVAIAERLGLERPHARRPVGYWRDFNNIAGELRAFLRRRPKSERARMPTEAELTAAGCVSLVRAISRHGGCGRLRRLGT
jgi:hypothetical protein